MSAHAPICHLRSIARPVTLWVPPRGDLPECWLTVRHIVSLYYSGTSSFIEMPRRTLELKYKTHEEAEMAANWFADAMANEPTQEMEDAYPKPIGGAILHNSQ